ncbi:hypothetical protein F5X96DRAFT_636258 [Biscogniauxia mediterranea]|nr:hypothetical protein F5X96DRAFT_636258 [Biscogniauxia mediterranea]
MPSGTGQPDQSCVQTCADSAPIVDPETQPLSAGDVSEPSQPVNREEAGLSAGDSADTPSDDRPSSTTLIMPQVPDLNRCGRFNGDEAASRWLSRLRWEFRRSGYNDDEPSMASEVIQAVDMLSEGQAATYIDNHPQIQAALDRAREGMAVRADMIAVEQALKDRFPAQLVDDTVALPGDELKALSQGDDEPLAAYYSRTQNLLRRMGGRDIPWPLWLTGL